MDRTNAERQARWRQRQKELIQAARRAADGASPSSAATEELERLRGENVELRKRAATAEMEVVGLRRQLAAAQARPAKPQKPAEPATESEEVAALQRHLKAAQTRIRNLSREKAAGWREAEKAANAAPAVLTKKDQNVLRKVFHPDTEAGASEESKKLLTQAAQIFNRLKLQVIAAELD